MIPINVWIVEDDNAYRNTLMRMLIGRSQISDCRAFPSCIEFLEVVSAGSARPDIVLMDLGLPGMGGLEGIRKLAEVAPGVAVIVLTVFKDKEKVLKALEAGAVGYLLKTARRTEIVRGIQEVFLGGSALSPTIAKVVLEELRKPSGHEEFRMTEREVDVLVELGKGLSVKEIADVLNITRRTCATHLENIYAKLHVQSQSGAVATALRSGIIE